MNIWNILGIEKTRDKEAIQAAYRKKLTVTNPEDSPQEFMRLREALEEALRRAEQEAAGSGAGAGEEAETESADETPVRRWIKEVDEVYRCFSKRINPKVWQELLRQEVCCNLDQKIEARDALLSYLMEHYFLPQSVVCLLDQHFALQENLEEMKELFPAQFLKQVIVEPAREEEYPPYRYLKGDDSLPFEEYLALSVRLGQELEAGNTQEARRVIEEMEATGIQSPFLILDKAKVCCQEERFAEAKSLTDPLLPEYDELDDVHLMKGDIAFFLKDYGAAEWEYALVQGRNPSSSWAAFGMGKCLVKAGEYKKANEIFCRLLEEDPYDMGASEWLKSCNDLHIESLRRKGTEDGEDFWELAWCLFQNGEYAQVLDLLPAGEPEEAHRLEYHSLVGRSYLFLEQEKKALPHLKAWEGILLEMPDSSDKKKEQLPFLRMLESNAYQELGEKQKALDLAESVLRENPHDAEALRQKGRLLYERWNFEEAADCFSAAIAEEPEFHVHYALRARAYFHMEYYGEAFDDCETCLELYPYELMAYEYKIRVLLAAGELEAAEETIDFLKKEKISGSGLLLLEGMLKEARGQEEEAEKIYRQVIREYGGGKSAEERFPMESPAEAYFCLAALLYDEDAEDFSSIIRLIDQGLKEDSAHVPLLEMKTDIAGKCGHFREALRLCRKIRKAAPDKIGTWGLMDGLYRELEEWDEALACAEKQLAQTPCAYAYMRRGQILTSLSRMEEAWADFEKAVSLEPEMSWPYNYMGVILELAGKEEEALSYYHKAIAAGREEEEPCDEAYFNGAGLFCRRKEFSRAISLLAELYERSGDTRCLYEQLEIRRLAGQPEEAGQTLEEYRQEEGLRKRDFLYKWELAHIYRDSGRLDYAFDFYDVEGVIEPAARREAGKILYYRGKFKKALAYFRKALVQLGEEHEWEEDEFLQAEYYLWAARACLKLNKKEDAFLLAEEGLEQIPEGFEEELESCLPMVYKLLGALRAIQGRYEEAEAYLKKALAVRVCDYCRYSCCADAWYEMGYLRELQDRRQEARACYGRGLETAPRDSDLTCAARILEKGSL